ncbi:response regulator [Marinomonas sp.]
MTPNPPKWHFWMPSFILLCGILLSFYSERTAEDKNTTIISGAVDEQFNALTQDMIKGIKQYDYGLRGLLAAIDAVGYDNFDYNKQLKYFNSRDYTTEFPGSRGFGFIRKVDLKDLSEFLTYATKDKGSPFTLKQLEQPKDPLFIIQYIEPEANNKEAVGLDIGSEQTRRYAALMSAASRTTQLTGPITLVQANELTSHGFLLLHPVFSKNKSYAENTLVGWVYTPLLINEILDSVIAEKADFSINIDDSSTSQPVHFYNSTHDELTQYTDYKVTNTVEVFGRLWSITITPTDNFINAQSLENPNYIFWQMVILTSLITILTFFLSHFFNQRLIEMRQKLAFSAVVNNASDSIVGVDRNFAITHWNSAADHLFNFTHNHALGKPLTNWLSSNVSSEKLINTFKNVAKGEVIRRLDFRYKSDAFGEERFLSMSISPIIEKGVFSGATVSLNDLTELNDLQQKLIEANVQLEKRVGESTEELQKQLFFKSSIINSTYSAIIACDKDGNISLFNKVASSLLGYTQNEVIEQKNVLDIINTNSIVADFNEKLPADFFTLLMKESNTETHISIDCSLKRKSGSDSKVNLVIAPIMANNEIEGYVFIANDLTEKQSLQKHLDLVDAAVDNSQDILLWLNTDGTIFNSNPFASVALGLKPYDLQSIDLADIISTGITDSWTKIRQRIMNEGRITFEANFHKSNNSLIPVLISACTISIEDTTFIYLAAKNISERLENEKRIEDALIKADSANMAKTEFIANMSHDLRTPLNAVNGYIQLMELSRVDEIQRKYIHDAKISVNEITQIVDDILDVTYVEKNALTLENIDFELDDVLNEVGSQLYANVNTKPVEIHLNVDKNVPFSFNGDRNKLKRILLNLGGNAVKFTSTGEIVISISAQSNSKNNTTQLYISVKDTGIGIPPAKLNHVFETFAQANQNASKHYGGIGIGLTICNQYIKLMHGELHVESEVGVGSCFSFDITLQSAKNAHTININEHFQHAIKVLLVDDNQTSLEILSNTVQQLGWDITTANNADDALRIFESSLQSEKTFDLALLDWKMPNKDGWELADSIRKSAPKDKTPLLIMVTAHSQNMMSQQYERFPNLLNGFLTKPVTRSQMVDAFVEAIAAANQQTITASSFGSTKPLADKRVLVVEDNPTNQYVAKALLSSQGANVTMANNGPQALDELENSLLAFDIVLMDIRMPDMDGYEVTRRIRSNNKFKQLPIIAMTANVITSEKEKCIDAGMNGHISKPFDLEGLVYQILMATQPKAITKTHPETPNKLYNINSETLEFCQDHDIDVVGAMERFNFSTDIYLRSLNLFISDITEYQSQLKSHNSTKSQLKLIFHTLKSTAGSVGFTQLSEAAKEQEIDISEWVENASYTAYQNDFINLIHSSIDQIKELITKFSVTEKKPETPNEEDFMAIYNLLKSEIDSSNMHAIDSFQRILPQLNKLSPKLADELIRLLNILKFKDAKTIISQFDQLM